MRKVSLAVVFAVCAGLMGGCQREAKSQFGERAVVKGKVTSGGKALTKGFVVYTPIDTPTKGEERGQLGTGGEYLTSVFPGKYKVSVVGAPEAPAKYQSPQTTDLEIEITSSGKDNADFDLR